MGSGSSVASKREIKGCLKNSNQESGCDITRYLGQREMLYLAKQLEKQENQHVQIILIPCLVHGAEALGDLIARNTSLKALNIFFSLSNPPLGEGFDSICKGLMANETLTSLTLSFLPWPRSYVDSLLEMIRCNKGLCELLFRRSSGLKDGAVDVLEAVIDAGRIERLRLPEGCVTLESLQGMCDALRRNKTLRYLHMEFEALGEEAAQLLGEVLSKDTILEQLELVHSKVDTEGVASLLNGLKQNKTLCHLNLGGTRLGPEGARLLADMLRKNDVLEKLRLVYCALETEGVDAVMDALLHNTTLKTLDVGSNDLQSGKSIARMLAKNCSLTKLHSYGQINLKDEGVAMIAEGLKENSTLKELVLSGCGFERDGALRVAEVLQSNSSLRVLNLYGNQLSAEGMVALAEALVGHRSIASLYMLSHPEVLEKCVALLMKGNGSLVECKNMFEDVCARNRAMHDRVRQSVQALRVLRWRQGGDSILHIMAKEVVKMIGVALWNTRTEIAVWATK